jgi:hypothetical protein
LTLGRSIGRAFGGQQFVLVKPSFLIGGDRPNSWGLELTYRFLAS